MIGYLSQPLEASSWRRSTESPSHPTDRRSNTATASTRVPDHPIVPFIEGDGTGRDIWKASVRVFDAAVEKAYHGKRSVAWYEVFAGEKAKARFQNWLPDDTISAIREFRVAIKGPLTTPVGGGIRSLNVALRQILDLYGCVRPVKYYAGVPSPVKHPERMNIVIFRENTEDVYIGIEWEEGTPDCRPADRIPQQRHAERRQEANPPRFRRRHQADFHHRHQAPGAHGHPACSRQQDAKSVTLVHKGNIQKFTEGAFRKWGYELATEEFRDKVVTERESWIIDNKDKNPNLTVEQNANLVEPGLEFAHPRFPPGRRQRSKDCLDSIYATHGKGAWKKKLMINDRIADSIFQQVVTRADEYSVLATPNLNGDYISDACAAQVGGLGIAPGANIGDGYAIFEATHGTAPKYADKDVINPGSVILSGVMMFRFLGWTEAADLIEQSLERTIEQKKVTYDFERLMEGATKVKTSEFANCMIENMTVAVAAD